MPEFPRKDFRLHVGWRTIKTAVSAMLVAIVYCLIGRNPAFACIGVIFGMGVDMQDEVHQICQKFHVHLDRDLRLKAFPLYPSHACGTTPTAALLPLRGRLHPFSCLARSHACPFRRHHGPALPVHHRPGPGR